MFIQNDNSPAIQHGNRIVKEVWRLTFVEASRKRPQKIRQGKETESLDRRGLIYLYHFLKVASSFSGGSGVFVCKSLATLPSSVHVLGTSNGTMKTSPCKFSIFIMSVLLEKISVLQPCTRPKSLCSQAALFYLNSLCLSKNIWLI